MQSLLPSKVNISDTDKWRGILDEVDKNEIPVEIIDRVTVHLIDDTEINIGVRALLVEGNDPKSIEEHLNKSLSSIEDYIQDVDFHIHVRSVADVIQPLTDQMLKNL